MSRKSEIIAAFDIGTAKTIVIIGRKDDQDEIEVISCAKVNSLGVKRGRIWNVEEVAQSIKTVLDLARKGNDFGEISKVYVGINGQGIFSEEVEGEKELGEFRCVKNEDLEALIHAAEGMETPEEYKTYMVVPQRYRVDKEEEIKNPVGVKGKSLYGNFKLVLGRRTYEEDIRFCIKKAGLNLDKVFINPVVTASSVLTDDEKEAGVVLVDIGCGVSTVTVYYDNILRHVGVVPFGGEVVTLDIKEGCSLLLRQAESLKVRYGSALGDNAADDKVVTISGMKGWEPKEISFKSLACIIQARAEEVIESLFYQIEQSGYAEKLGAGIVVTGGGSQLTDLVPLIRLKTGMEVRKGKMIKTITGQSIKKLESPDYSSALGIFIEGLKYAVLLPEGKKIVDEGPHVVTHVEQINVKPGKVKTSSFPRARNKHIDVIKNLFSQFFTEKEEQDQIINDNSDSYKK